MAGPAAPTGAGPAGRRLWREVLRVYELGEHELVVLRDAVRVVDFTVRLQKLLDDEGLVDGEGRKHWAIAELRLQRRLVAQLLAGIRIPADVGERTAGAAPDRPADAGAEPPPRTQHRGIRGVYQIRGGTA